MKIEEILIKNVNVKENHRSTIDESELAELMQSIKQNGLRLPIEVEPDGKKFSLVSGHRRLIACTKLGHLKISALIIPKMDRKQNIIVNLTENMQRVNPTFPEMGRAIMQLEKEGLTFEQMSIRLGKPEKFLRRIAKTYNALPEKHREKVKFMAKGDQKRQGGIPHTLAIDIANIRKSHGLSEALIDKLIAHITKTNMSKDNLNNLAIMLTQGLTIEDAIKKMEEYHIYHLDVIAPTSLILRLMQEHNCNNTGAFFKKIIYGEIPSIPRPSFVNMK